MQHLKFSIIQRSNSNRQFAFNVREIGDTKGAIFRSQGRNRVSVGDSAVCGLN